MGVPNHSGRIGNCKVGGRNILQLLSQRSRGTESFPLSGRANWRTSIPCVASNGLEAQRQAVDLDRFGYRDDADPDLPGAHGGEARDPDHSAVSGPAGI